MSKQNPKGENPEALSKFADSGRAKGGKVKRTGVEATPETKPMPADPKLEHEAATRIMHEGGMDKDGRAEELVKDELPDRITRDRNR
jgi:hypothetical protein